MKNEKANVYFGPQRVLPGRLSVSRTFGDPEAKLPKYGGNPNVVVAKPDIASFQIASDHDFIAMGSDGIFDKLNSDDLVKCAWQSISQEHSKNTHEMAGIATDAIIKNSLFRRSLDNVTVVFIAFPNFTSVLSNKEFIGNVLNNKIIEQSDSKGVQRGHSEVRKKEHNNAMRNNNDNNRKNHLSCVSLLSRVVPQTSRYGKAHFDFQKVRGNDNEKSALYNSIS